MASLPVEPATAQYRSAFVHAHDALIILDSAGVCLEVNAAACALFDLPATTLVGSPLTAWLAPEPDSTGAPIWTDFLAAGQARGECTLAGAADGPRVVEYQLIGHIVPDRHLAVLRDVTTRRQVTAALHESRRITATLLSNLPGMAYRCRTDTDWTLGYVSEGCQELLGYTQDELLRPGLVSYEQLIHPDDRAMVRREIDAAVQEGRPFQITYRLRTATGAEKWVWARGGAINTPPAEPILEGFVTDITPRWRAVTALHLSDSRFAKIFRASPTPIGLSRLADGQVIDVNESWLRDLGYQREEVIGQLIDQLGAWAEPGARARLLDLLHERGAVHDLEVSLRRKSGEMRRYTLAAEIIEADGELCLLTLFHDITERKQAEEALRRSEEQFAKVFRASPDGMSITRVADQQVIDANESWLALTGYTREEALGRSTDDLSFGVDPADLALLRELLRTQGYARDWELRFRKKDGTVHTALISLEYLEIAGARCVLTIARDVTERKQAEEALRQSEERFAKAFRSGPDPLNITRLADERIIDVNDRWLTVTGYARQEVIGQTATELGLWVHPADRARISRLLGQQGFAREEEVAFRMKSGEVRWCLLSMELIESGGEQAALSIVRDITERKQADEALRRSEERFAKAFHLSPNAQLIMRAADGAILDVNDHCLGMLGYSRAEVIGNTVAGLGLAIDLARAAAGEALLAGQGFLRDLEIQFRRKSGEPRQGICSVEPIEIGGEPCLLVIADDITERKQAEAQMRLLEAAVQHAVDPVLIIEADFAPPGPRVVFVNPSFVQQTGYTLADLATQNIRRLLGPRTDPAVRDQVYAALRGDQPFHGEMTNYRKDGSTYLAEWQISPIPDAAGRVTHWVAVQRDITERRALEERAQAGENLRALGYVAAGVAHEFNNVLAAIMGRLDLLATARPDPEVTATLRLFQQAVEDGAAMVQRIQRFARPVGPGAFQPVVVADLIQDVVTLTQPHWQAAPERAGHPIALDLQIAAGLVVLGDPTELREVVTNLILNAVDALPAGGRIIIRATPQEAQAVLSVQDTGAGLDPALHKRIFDPFFTTKLSGSGLGLTVVQSIVQNHGGTISVDSAPGQGARFTVTLPAAGAAAAPSPLPAAAPAAPVRGARILAVDDDPGLGEMLKAMLAPAGHAVTVTTSGAEALALLAPGAFDLVCTDLGMPGMNGWEVARQVQARAPGTPVILITGWGMQLDPADLAAHGISTVLFKPYRMRAAQELIGAVLAQRDVKRET